MTDPWQAQLEALGAYIRTQREMANLSLRQLAALSTISNPYLSQLERGQHEPSLRVLIAIANALELSLADLLARLGLHDPTADRGPRPDRPATRVVSVEDAIDADPLLDGPERTALLTSYRAFVGAKADGRRPTKRGKQ